MVRRARMVATGYPHHVTQRGNNKRGVFEDNYDRRKYLFYLKKYCCKYGLVIISYCLMPNHVHFVAIPNEKESLAKVYGCAHMRYAQYFNDKVEASGHLWQGRFYSCILDERHLFAAARYVERNPVRAELAKEAGEWKWSSARYHVGLEKDKGIISGNLFDYIKIRKEEWRECLRMGEEGEYADKLRDCTRKGLPLGTEEFMWRLETKIGRILWPSSKGRPNKK
ncbi:MAG: transposase [Candidatus Saganbacteria bacterium]|nr:transposase [Candidatus Saganbacteria bacterium]